MCFLADFMFSGVHGYTHVRGCVNLVGKNQIFKNAKTRIKIVASLVEGGTGVYKVWNIQTVKCSH